MENSGFIHLLQWVLSTVGGIGVVIVAIVGWTSKWGLNKILESDRQKNALEIESVRNQYTTELEYLRAEVSRSSKLLDNAMMVMSQMRSAVTERQLTAVESLWNGICEFDSKIEDLKLLHDILRRDEYDDALNTKNERLRRSILSVEPSPLLRDLNTLQQGGRQHRLYVTTDVWDAFQQWVTLYGRVTYAFMVNIANHKFRPWQEDVPIQQLIIGFLSSEEERFVHANEMGELGRLAFVLQERFLTEALKMISGNDVAREHLVQASLLVEELAMKRRELLQK